MYRVELPAKPGNIIRIVGTTKGELHRGIKAVSSSELSFNNLRKRPDGSWEATALLSAPRS